LIFNGFVQSADRFADRVLTDLLTDLMIYLDMISIGFLQSADRFDVRLADRFDDLYGFTMIFIGCL